MALEPIIVVDAIISFIVICVFVFIGLVMIFKYVKHKFRSFLYLGLTWIGLGQAWLGEVITVFMVTIDENSPGLSPEVYLILTSCFIPLIVPLYTLAMTDMTLEKYKKPLVIIFTSYSIFFEIFVFAIILPGNVNLLMTKYSPINFQPTIITILLLSAFTIDFLVLGYFFCFKCFKSESPEIKLKGRILFTSYTLFTISNFLDAFELVIFQRFLLIIAVGGFYLGFMLPDIAKKLFLRSYKQQN